ncbi:hypothetical protein, unlikely [Trypanosoma brucei gambiense DAL972]|uniref:Uncharacterized protein n=1 Tax=Trypanosoma brucei gambiense (strain MHOM/CI/86/DAL972) TaxID=679716 RepID=D0A2F5_TRYB9|nr:hypothetical protein, unlikely [Trypanosoma brucei gambiense DAL972]CBH15449.1 hypothetical protein, unlikely [Trypanosoma brucei gambiense DAL972]|eukprot:XP_011777713.1 hypothetical protein, unlikely [Trypanosoma brucei gambiense DAL972]
MNCVPLSCIKIRSEGRITLLAKRLHLCRVTLVLMAGCLCVVVHPVPLAIPAVCKKKYFTLRRISWRRFHNADLSCALDSRLATHSLFILSTLSVILFATSVLLTSLVNKAEVKSGKIVT